MEFVLTPEETKHADVIMHDTFPRHVEKDLHRYLGGFVVSKSGWWCLADRRTGHAAYGHA